MSCRDFILMATERLTLDFDFAYTKLFVRAFDIFLQHLEIIAK